MNLDDLKALIKATPISQIIGQYLDMHKQGSGFLAVCPFHDDHDPSMQINDNRNMFMCFVDQTGGDAITFVKEYKKCGYVEALRDICEKMGWNFDDYNEKSKANPKKQLAKKLLKNSTLIYEKLGHSDNHSEFPEFLKQRGISVENAKKYELGFSPKHNVFLNYLESIKDQKERTMALQVAFEVGLIKQNLQTKQYYDTFRERIMFPIWDQYGNVTAFTSRMTKEYQKAKYMNSKDSFMFNKKNILYGLHLAKDKMRERDRVIIVEGNMDQLSLYINGFEESVAIMGVAMSENSVNILKSYTNNFYLCTDNDPAGFKAAERINDLLIQKGYLAKIVDLAPYKDPDDLICEIGKIAFEERLQNAKLMIDLQIEMIIPDEIPEVVDRKIEILQSAYRILAPLKSDLRATERIVALSKELGLETSKEQILQSYQDFLKNLSNRNTPQQPATTTELNIEEPAPINMEPQYIQEVTPKYAEVNHAELLFIEKCIVTPELFEWPETEEILEIIDQNEVKEIVLELKNFFFEFDEQSYHAAVERIVQDANYDKKIREHIGVTLFKKESSHTPKFEKTEIPKLINNLKEEKLKLKKKGLREEHARTSEQSKAQELLSKIMEVDRQIQNLKKEKFKNISQ